MPKTREEVQKAFGLAEPPDDEFMQLLEQVGEGDAVTGVAPVEWEGYSAEDLADEFADAVIADTIGELLARAREETGRSLRDVGQEAGLSHARVRELEQSTNVEIATISRLARAMGFKAKIVLEPDTRFGRFRKLEANI